ncbi:hypothetical protein A8F94_16670 [Bacillus sp. FJAT-27225]|uniref:phosphatase PAP2 family protein n=1 Tax=Bacillus sp. FJAT-27225 TaxID=1743144 RepID=UPI00080C2669|nr:phosphatase PAP2 family protein [Bacillus sp. FJAT-27225]OCA84341.1 hypothetical protein A8F94_16670 [Bacillus sp. FJAT-27225]
MTKRNMLYNLLVIALLAIPFLLIGVKQGRPLLIDEAFAGLLSYVPEAWDPIFKATTELGDKRGVGVVALLMLGWLLIKRRDFFAMGIFALAVALGNEVNKLLKEIIGRERPTLEHLVEVNSLSFPSGHAMVGSILYLLVGYFLMKEYRRPKQKQLIATVCVILILLIGASRVILNVHYPTDVLGGYAFGFIWAVSWLFVYEFIRRKYPLAKNGRRYVMEKNERRQQKTAGWLFFAF